MSPWLTANPQCQVQVPQDRQQLQFRVSRQQPFNQVHQLLPKGQPPVWPQLPRQQRAQCSWSQLPAEWQLQGCQGG